MEDIARSICALKQKHLNEQFEPLSDSDAEEDQLALEYIFQLCQQAREKALMSKRNAIAWLTSSVAQDFLNCAAISN